MDGCCFVVLEVRLFVSRPVDTPWGVNSDRPSPPTPTPGWHRELLGRRTV
jgi:hypothetical protein